MLIADRGGGAVADLVVAELAELAVVADLVVAELVVAVVAVL